MLYGVNWPTYRNQLQGITVGDWSKFKAFATDSDGHDLCVRILHHAMPWDYALLLSNFPKITFIVRWYWPYGDTRPWSVLDAKKYADWPRTLRQTINWLRENQCNFVVELDNEPNVEWPEGTKPGRALVWWQNAMGEIKAAFPRVKVLMWALSPAGNFDAWWQVIKVQAEIWGLAAVHEYHLDEGTVYPVYQAVRDIYVTEFGSTTAEPSQHRAGIYTEWFDRYRRSEDVKAACPWTLGSDDPQFANNVLSLEECQILGNEISRWRRQEVPENEQEPKPEFVLGFAAYAAEHPEVGQPLDDQFYDAQNNAHQFTEDGELIWVKRANQVFFRFFEAPIAYG